MTIPGVGMVVAMSYKTDIGDPTRFKKSESVGAYYGMTPRQYSSGETVKRGVFQNVVRETSGLYSQKQPL